ncbi:MAG: hypothetical protein AAB475_01355 [Patescibacteria group bacterium]
MKKEPKITNEDLAMMIKNNVVDKMATKEDLSGVKEDLSGVKKDLRAISGKVDDIDKNVKEINMKLHDIGESVHGEHRRRIERLEEAVFEK